MQMDVSIIVPIYNVDLWLSQCLDSILSQKGLDLEIICINDCSTDNTGDILEEYRRKYLKTVKVFTHPINMGYGYSMNVGIQAANASITCIVDSDDYLLENSLYNICKQLKDTNADFIQMKQCLLVGGCCNLSARDFTKIVGNNLRKDNQYTVPIFPWSKVYKTSFVKNFKFTESPGASYQDVSFGGNVSFYADRISLYKEPTYAYRYYRTGNSSSCIGMKNRAVYVRYEYVKFLYEASQCDRANMVGALHFILNLLQPQLSAYLELGLDISPILIQLMQDIYRTYYHIFICDQTLCDRIFGLYNFTLKDRRGF